LATVNEDPEALMASHQLRKDLYFRLGVVILRIPPLRERREDIPLLVPPFIARYNRLYHLRVRSVSAEVMDLFHQHEWPGNVRELEHLIEGAMNLIGDEEIIGVEHLPPHLQSRLPSLPVLQHEESHQTAVHPLPLLNTSTLRDTPFQEQVKNFQRTLIHSALARQKGNVSAAAKDLQLSRQNLQYYLRHL
jgi:arginine utilization regulatory protein